MTSNTVISSFVLTLLTAIGTYVGVTIPTGTGIGAGIAMVLIGVVSHEMTTNSAITAATNSSSSTSQAATAAAAIPQVNPDFTVSPSYLYIKSGQATGPITIKVGASATGLLINWKDGTPNQSVPLSRLADLSQVAQVQHVYTLNQALLSSVGADWTTNKYTGYNYEPDFMVSDQAGGVVTFSSTVNTEGGGLSIDVSE
jgi:hypothetical protein